MWGGIYAVLFSVSTILSSENPIKNGFPEGPAENYAKYSLSNVEFQNMKVARTNLKNVQAKANKKRNQSGMWIHVQMS